jgi:hypothetical protein
MAEGVKQGRLGFRGATAGALIRGAGARVRLRPGLFGVRAGTRGGIATSEGAGLGFMARRFRSLVAERGQAGRGAGW